MRHSRFFLTTVSAAALALLTSAPVHAWTEPAGPDQSSVTSGSIGIPDNDPDRLRNQGVKAITAAAEQTMGDVRLVIPNTFEAGDIINLDVSAFGPAAQDTPMQRAVSVISGPSAVSVLWANDPHLSIYRATEATLFRPLTYNTPPSGNELSLKAEVEAAPQPHNISLHIANTHGAAKTGKWVVTLRGIKVRFNQETLKNEGQLAVKVRASNSGSINIFPPANDAGGRPDTTYPMYRPVTQPALKATPKIQADLQDHDFPQLVVETPLPLLSHLNGERKALLVSDYAIRFDGSDATCIVKVGNEKVPGVACIAQVSPREISATISGMPATPDPLGRLVSVHYFGVRASGLGYHGTSADITLWNSSIHADVSQLNTFSDKWPAQFAADASQWDLANPASTQPYFRVRLIGEPQRLDGANRYEVAETLAARQLLSRNVGAMVVTTGETFPDALSSGYLARAITPDTPLPLVLTPSGRVDASVKYIAGEAKANTIYVIGGSIQPQVLQELRKFPHYDAKGNEEPGKQADVVVIGGNTRYDVNKNANLLVLNQGRRAGSTVPRYRHPAVPTAILASGETPYDAMFATPLIAGAGIAEHTTGPLPLILTEGTKLSPQAQEQMKSFAIGHVIVVGSENSISHDVVKSLEAQGVAVTRIGGVSHFEVAENIARTAMRKTVTASGEPFGLGWIRDNAYVGDTLALHENLYLVNGMNFADGLTAGVNGMVSWLPNAKQVHLLAPMRTGAQSEYPLWAATLQRSADDITPLFSRVTAIGGKASVPDAALAIMRKEIEGVELTTKP